MKDAFTWIRDHIKKEHPFAIGSPALVWQVLFFYLPLALVFLTSIFHISQTTSLPSLTLSHFTPLFHSSYFLIILSSLALSTATALGTLVIAYPLAYFIAFQPSHRKGIFLFLLFLPFWANFLLHVYSWFFVLQQKGFLNFFLQAIGLSNHPIEFLNSLFAILLVMIYHFLPFMVLPIFSVLERFNRSFLEASRSLGASWGQTFTHVLLPLTLPAIRTGFFIVFISSFGEFIIPELMGGDRWYFAGNVISQYILGNDTGGIGAAFMVLSFVALAIAGIVILRLFHQLTGILTKKEDLS